MITRTRVAALVAIVAITAAGWATSAVVSKDATDTLELPCCLPLLVRSHVPDMK